MMPFDLFLRFSLLILSFSALQIEAYKDMIAPVVDAFKYLTQVRIDIFVKQAVSLLFSTCV